MPPLAENLFLHISNSNIAQPWGVRVLGLKKSETQKVRAERPPPHCRLRSLRCPLPPPQSRKPRRTEADGLFTQPAQGSVTQPGAVERSVP